MTGKVSYQYREKKFTLLFPLSSITKAEGLTILPEVKDTPAGKRISVILKPEGEAVLESLFLEKKRAFQRTDRIFINGYQSWTESREYGVSEKMPGLLKILRPLYGYLHLEYFGDYYFHKYSGKKGVFHGYTYTYIRDAGNSLEFCGSLSEESGFTVFQFVTGEGRLFIKKDCAGLKISGAFRAFDLLICHGAEKDVFEKYFQAMRVKKTVSGPLTGWTSWYNYYTGITEKIILENLDSFKDKNIPLDIFQIDDGYQEAVGDWLAVNRKFPDGMKYIAGRIKKAGYKAGLWIAPFICTEDSGIFSGKKDWLIKDGGGRPLIIGFNPGWKSRFYALDFYNPGVRKYLKKVFSTVLEDWGFDMVKLDFLYAACISPGENMTRGRIMTEAVKFLRELAGNKLILGCGVPLGPAFGRFDFCRIGPDMGLEWEFKNGAVVRYRERVSTVNALVNAAGRRQLGGRAFQNDPDVFILRRDKNSLKAGQKYTLFLINLIFGGLVFTSDNITGYSGEELGLYLSQFPPKKKKIVTIKTFDAVYQWRAKPSLLQLISGTKPYSNAYQIDFEIEGRGYTVLSNLGNKTAGIKPREGIYYNGTADEFIRGGKEIRLRPYQSLCLLKIGERDFEPAGSTGHIFPFCDVKFKISGNNISLKGLRKTTVYFKIPPMLKGFRINGGYCAAFEKEGLRLIKKPING